MKIGILTFHKAKNYGAILQAYALHTALKKNNIDSEIIDYDCDYFRESYKILSLKNRSIKNIIKQLLLFNYKRQKYKKMENFIKKNMKLSANKNILKSTMKKVSNNYEKIIVGSDQVWNLNCTNGDLTYFLDFEKSKEKKYSYAASFGKSSVTKNEKKIYKKYLSDFNKISVREKDGKKILDEILNEKVKVVSDPTLLLNRNEWDNICSERLIEKNYILVYTLYSSPEIREFAQKKAKEENLDIVVIQSDLKREIKKSKVIRNAGIEEFISLIKHANYVITNSFHGTIFSLLYNKEFYISLIKGDNAPNSRIENLLKEYKVEQRIIDYNEYEKDKKKIEYENVNKKIQENKKESLDYLLEIARD